MRARATHTTPTCYHPPKQAKHALTRAESTPHHGGQRSRLGQRQVAARRVALRRRRQRAGGQARGVARALCRRPARPQHLHHRQERTGARAPQVGGRDARVDLVQLARLLRPDCRVAAELQCQGVAAGARADAVRARARPPAPAAAANPLRLPPVSSSAVGRVCRPLHSLHGHPPGHVLRQPRWASVRIRPLRRVCAHHHLRTLWHLAPAGGGPRRCHLNPAGQRLEQGV